MRYRINETAKGAELVVVDLITGENYTEDAIADSGDFRDDALSGAPMCSREASDWWQDYASLCYSAHDRYAELSDEDKKTVRADYQRSYQEFSDAPSVLVNCINRLICGHDREQSRQPAIL